MEKQDFDNKLLKKLDKGLINLSEVIDDAMGAIDETINDKLTEKEAISFNAFKDKYINHIVNGEHKEAKELQKAFNKQMTK